MRRTECGPQVAFLRAEATTLRPDALHSGSGVLHLQIDRHFFVSFFEKSQSNDVTLFTQQNWNTSAQAQGPGEFLRDVYIDRGAIFPKYSVYLHSYIVRPNTLGCNKNTS